MLKVHNIMCRIYPSWWGFIPYTVISLFILWQDKANMARSKYEQEQKQEQERASNTEQQGK